MALTNKVFNLTATTKIDIREEIIKEFLKELPGTATQYSYYNYEVESYQSYKILLKRPAILNKGFDFQVNIIDVSFLYTRNCKNGVRNYYYTYPKHEHIYDVLQQVKQAIGSNYSVVKAEINNVYNLRAINSGAVSGIFFLDGQGVSHPIQILLLAIKWLFIEQDMTYWNYSGREMFLNELRNRGLA